MKLEEIQEVWSIDSEIDDFELDAELLKITKLHSKYYKMFSNENMMLYKLESELKLLQLDKFEFYTQGNTKETMEKGWTLPAKGMVIKSEVPMYMEADRDIIKLNLKIALQREKVEFLESIIKTFNNRGFNIKSAIEFRKFQAGS